MCMITGACFIRVKKIIAVLAVLAGIAAVALLAPGCDNGKPAASDQAPPAATEQAQPPAPAENNKKTNEIFGDVNSVCVKMAEELQTSATRKLVVADFYFPETEGIDSEHAAAAAKKFRKEISGLMCSLEMCHMEFNEKFSEIIAGRDLDLETIYSFQSFTWVPAISGVSEDVAYILLGKFHPEDDSPWLEMAVFDLYGYKSVAAGKLYVSI